MYRVKRQECKSVVKPSRSQITGATVRADFNDLFVDELAFPQH